eukprot:GEMP01044300.1.p1 GENE.GEMP01044300.1~~GEMP01044300.1.p1  ORF type:complete len:218 (+),score=68.40 GEMP01044300.1:155-808(+)
MGFFSRFFGRSKPPRYDPGESYRDNVMVADWSDIVAAPILDDDGPSTSLQPNTPTRHRAASATQGRTPTLMPARVPVKKTSVTSSGVPGDDAGEPRSSKRKSRARIPPVPGVDSPYGTPQRSANDEGEWTAEEWAAWKAKKKKKSKNKGRVTLDQWDSPGGTNWCEDKVVAWTHEQREARGSITQEAAGARGSPKKRKSKKKYSDAEWAAWQASANA